MLGLNGLEPSTSRLSGVRSNHLSYRPTYGGDKEIRTLDPLRARQVLSQPSTSRLSGVRSNHLSYRPTYGGDKEIRTLDPLRARQVLSQLSYTPIFSYVFLKTLLYYNELPLCCQQFF